MQPISSSEVGCPTVSAQRWVFGWQLLLPPSWVVLLRLSFHLLAVEAGFSDGCLVETARDLTGLGRKFVVVCFVAYILIKSDKWNSVVCLK